MTLGKREARNSAVVVLVNATDPGGTSLQQGAGAESGLIVVVISLQQS